MPSTASPDVARWFCRPKLKLITAMKLVMTCTAHLTILLGAYGDVHDVDLGVKHQVTYLLILIKVLRAGGTKFDDAYFVQLVFSR